MIFYRISAARFDTPTTAFSGEGATKVAHRWNHPRSEIRAVYCSDSLALACLECLVHIRPLPRVFPGSLYYSIEVPDHLLEIPAITALPASWNAEVADNATRDFGMAFLRERRAVGLVVPTAIQPLGQNVIINPLHPRFDLSWVTGPFNYKYDGRLA